MKHSFFFRYVALALAAVIALPLLGCGGCVSHEKKRDGDIGDSRAIEWKLSPEAQTTYAFLLYDQALRQEDEEALVSSLQALSSGQSPVGIYVESGIWLMSRKSPLALRALEIGLRQFPDDSSLNLLYAEALMENDEAAKAIDHMRAYVAKYPDSIDARLELALLLVLAAGVWMLVLVADGLGAVVALMEELADQAGLSETLLEPVVKTVALSILTRLTAEICRSAGEGGVAAFVETAGTVLALLAALPLVRAVAQLMGELLI